MIERFEIDTINRHTITSNVTLCCAETGRVIAVFYSDYDAEALLAAAPRPEAGRQSDAFLVWLPRLIAEYEKQARHNEFTPDVSLDFVKRALAEYKHAAKQPAPRPVPAPIPTSERLPTEVHLHVLELLAKVKSLEFEVSEFTNLYRDAEADLSKQKAAIASLASRWDALVVKRLGSGIKFEEAKGFELRECAHELRDLLAGLTRPAEPDGGAV